MKSKDCEYDCANHCSGCDRNFCEIKDSEGLDHEHELPEYRRTTEGNYYCHIDCFSDSRG